MSLSSKKKTVDRLVQSKTYRDAYVLEHIKNGIAFQIRTLRDERGWTQGKLGEEAKKPRNVISRLEDPNYGKYTLATLQELASAFEVGLLVKFVPFSRLVKEYEDVSPNALSAKSIIEKDEIQELDTWAQDDEAPTSTNVLPKKEGRLTIVNLETSTGQITRKKSKKYGYSNQKKFLFMYDHYLKIAPDMEKEELGSVEVPSENQTPVITLQVRRKAA